jgi:hypothetical protein
LKISVAGEDVTSEVSANLEKVVDMRDGASVREELEKKDGILDLASAKTEAEFGGKHITELRHRCYVDVDRMVLPDGAMGGVGRILRKVAWKITKPFLAWACHKQNNVNAQIVQALELEKNERDRQLEELKVEIKALKNGRSGQEG